MASLPSQASWRRNASSDQSSLESIQPTSNTSAQLPTSTESFIINEPHNSEPSNFSASKEQSLSTTLSPTTTETICWICQQDPSEDAPGEEWRSPCPCSLTAHNECLLEWITSEEAPKPGDIATTHIIKCPQCKAPIKIERPRDYLVLAAEKVQSLAKVFVVPTAVSAFLGCFYSGFLVYGVNTLHVVFGQEDASKILAPDPYRRFLTDERLSILSKVFPIIFKATDPFFPVLEIPFNWKLFVGLPLIGPSLILSRTTIADKVFSLLPITYFLFRPVTNLRIIEWPPSPSLTFAVLPYFRTLYNELYRQAFGDLEKKWDAAVQRKPREGETAEQVAQERNRAENDALFDLEVEIRNGLDDDDGQMIVPEEHGGEEGGLPPVDGQQQDQEGDAGVRPNGAAPRRQQRLNRQNLSTGSLLSTTMGALFFPAISSAMGDLLKYSLPNKLVSRGVSYRLGSKGLLQEKWGRTVAGGCLFVVLKDAIILYCKWKKARDFGKKKILDYVGKRSVNVVSKGEKD